MIEQWPAFAHFVYRTPESQNEAILLFFVSFSQAKEFDFGALWTV